MLGQQLLHGLGRVAVQTLLVLSNTLALLQTAPMSLVLSLRDFAYLCEQVLFTLRCEQGLILPKVP